MDTISGFSGKSYEKTVQKKDPVIYGNGVQVPGFFAHHLITTIPERRAKQTFAILRPHASQIYPDKNAHRTAITQLKKRFGMIGGCSDLLFRAETVPDLFREELPDCGCTDEICVYLGRDTRVLIDQT